ncbi:MAG TPA: GNAT family N-acetyltransferase [Caldilineaceae bacterium]|nr:GNAT family N-acetyltransferase [Caldilineaceae bacterium]
MNQLLPSIETQPAADDLAFLEEQINEYNMTQTGRRDFAWLTLFVRNTAGAIEAGIIAYTWAGACRVQSLWVQEARRGQGYGRALLSAAEEEARRRGCHVIVLETHSFQAPAFYQRLGYTISGWHEDYPVGHRQYFLHKRLSDQAL